MPAKKKTAPVKLTANPRGSARVSKKPPLTPAQLKQIDAYWRASNYLTACQLYLLDNPLLERPLTAADLKQTIVGHWGTCPGQNFIYTHLDRVIKRDDLDMIYLSGPGHGGNAMVAQDWLDGSYTEVYPNITRDKDGMKKLFKRFSFPGGIPSHVAPETPGSIHEGGELGYSLAHAFGAVADNPSLIAACVVGDGEAETGPLATSWHGNKFMNPITDGAVLPILHLNGFKIANPTIFSRMSHEEVESFFRGCGWEPRFVEGSEPAEMHQKMAATVDWAIREIKRIQEYARTSGDASRPRWPMIVLRTPKGWTGPKEVDGHVLEGSWRAHQVPISMGPDTEKHLPELEEWLRSYKPEELFDEDGRPVELIRSFPPKGSRRMGANPHANGGLLLRGRLQNFVHVGYVAVHGAVCAVTDLLIHLGRHDLGSRHRRAQRGQQIFDMLGLLEVDDGAAAPHDAARQEAHLLQKRRHLAAGLHVGGGQLQMIALFRISDAAAGQKGTTQE